MFTSISTIFLFNYVEHIIISGMILSSKKKRGKLFNTKSDRHTHVGDMRCARGFYFQRGFLDF